MQECLYDNYIKRGDIVKHENIEAIPVAFKRLRIDSGKGQ
jgi:hypothetical protein